MENNTSISQAALQKFRQDALVCHNTYRQMHHAPPLVNDGELEKSAQDYAEKLAQSGIFVHSPPAERNFAGENLYEDEDQALNDTILAEKSKEVVDCFYDEIKDYDFKKPELCMKSGHFTQVVWCGSTKLGIGIAVGKQGTIVVARYEPVGNKLDDFEKNVLPK